MKKNSPSKKITHLCEKLATDLKVWEKIPTQEVKDNKKEREQLYSEIKQKIKALSN